MEVVMPKRKMPKEASGSRKYSDGASKKVKTTMHELKRGTLRSSSGAKVTSREQAIAIGLSEAREAGKKVPKRPKKKRLSG
jgi:hypothetical protein